MSFFVFTAFNEKYKIMGATLISSIWENNPNEISICILDLGLKLKSKSKILKWANFKKRPIKFFSINSDLYFKFLGKSIILPPNIEYYSRLLVPYFSNNIEKVLYLDADIICNKNFVSLFNIDLGENIIAAVQDSYFDIFSSTINKSKKVSIISNFKELGFIGDEKYFNSGVLLINSQKWIANDVSKKVLELAFKHSSHIFLWDQYSLNIYFSNSWSQLNKEFNETNAIDKRTTIFRHFTKVKPTSYQSGLSDLPEFYQYLDKTPWSKWRPNKYVEIYQIFLKKVKSIFL
jgi:lipopolysaccharide biosynthesis glycosyltransferase